MTRQETGIIMDILTAAYPRFYAGGVDMESQLKVWSELFADDDLALVAVAVKALIATDTKGYPPHIGAVKEQMRKLTALDEMSEAEAWARIRQAIRNSGYEAREEFAKLPPVLQKLVGSASQLHEWAMIDSDVLQSVVASNVQRGFRAIQSREREQAKLPGDVKKAVAAIASRYALPEGKEIQRIP